MNRYEAKQEAKRQRLEARAAKKAAEGSALYNRAHTMAEAIPFGQPILIGHHSEGRDRNYRGKIHSTFGRAFEAMNEGRELAGRAASVGTGGISSDDPDAVIKLRAELTELEAKQSHMVAVNKALRKGDDAAVLSLGVPASVLATWNDPKTSKWDKGYASFQLSNNSANVRRITQRIEQLKAAAGREHKELLHNSGVTLVQNVEENRVQLLFPSKPSEEVRSLLKSSGFRWSPIAGAWQRHLNNAGIYAAQNILRQIPTDAAEARHG